jgi:hypothetical protein
MKKMSTFRNLISTAALALCIAAIPNLTKAQKTKIVTKQCLDSIVPEKLGWGRDKYVFSYDERGNTMQILECVSAYSENAWYWGMGYKCDYAYDDKGNRTECAEYAWSSSTNEWRTRFKSERTYDDKGNMIKKHVYSGSNNVWVDNQVTEYRYDDKGNVIEAIVYAYYCNEYSCGWRVHTINRYEYTYDVKGNITEIIIQSNGLKAGKDEYTYDSMGNMVEQIKYLWNNSKGWYEDQKYEYAYDENGNKTKYIRYEFDPWTNDWAERDKYDYLSYDSMGNNTEFINWYWSVSDKQLNKSHYRYEFTYNLSYSNTELLIPDMSDISSITYINYKYNGMLTEMSEYYVYPNGNTSPSVNPITYYWTARDIEVEDEEEDPDPDPTGIVETGRAPSLPPRVYPNPTNYELTITNYEGGEIEIFNVVGQCVGAYLCGRPAETGAGASPARTIDVSHLAKGMYYLKIEGKVVKFVKH